MKISPISALLLALLALHQDANAMGGKPLNSIVTKPVAALMDKPLSHEISAVTSQIFRGPRPNSNADILYLRRIGVRTIINLQGNAQIAILPGESAEDQLIEKNNAERAGLRYISAPTSTFSTLTPDEQQRLIQIAAMMNDPQLQPVFVHCIVGVDRTGVAVAAYRILYQGCSYKQAYWELVKEGKPWTPMMTASQISFLKALEKNQPAISGSLHQSCPL
jgi:protein tyrosine/serine phosphatase